MSERQPYRAAVVGCGWIGAKVAADPLADGVQAHAEAYDVCSDTRLVGVCDLDSEAVGWACRRWPSARGHADVDAMLESERPQIVSVCTPDASHAAVCQKVLRARGVRAIVVEKPLATTTADARLLLLEANRRNILVVVNHSRRFATSHQALRQEVAAGSIGSIVAVAGLYSKGILHNGSHWLDLVRWFVGEIVQVEAWHGLAPGTEDPTCHVRVAFENGVQAVLMGIDGDDYSVFELDLLGSRGRLRIVDSGHRVEYLRAGASEHYAGYRTLGLPQATKAGFRDVALRLVENTVEVLCNGGVPHCSGGDGYAALAIAEAATRSLGERKPLDVNPTGTHL